MNSPAHFKPVNFPVQMENRFFNKHANNVNNMNPPIYSHQNIPNNIISFRNTKVVSQTGKKDDQKSKQAENLYKNTVRNIYNKNIVNSDLIVTQPKISDASINSIKETQDENTDLINSRITTINDQLTLIFNKLTAHDTKFQQIYQKMQKLTENSNKKNQIFSNIQEIIWKDVAKQVSDSQQHLLMQNKLIKADLDTLKLQILCYADKKQVKTLNQKIDEAQKNLRKKIKQVQQSNAEETHKILEKRKLDVQRFQKQVQEMKTKMMNIIFQAQNKQDKGKMCLIKSLSFRVLHQMQVYNQKQLKWIELGTGETVYGVDQEGYLLDNQNKYIVDSNQNLIKLENTHIEILRKYGLTR